MLICCFSACFSFTSSTALMTSCDTTLVSLLSSINCKIRVKSQNLLLLIVLNEQNKFFFCFWWFRVIQWILYFFVVLFFVWGCGGWAAPLKPTHILHMSKVVLCTTRHVSCHLAYQCVKQHQWGFFCFVFLFFAISLYLLSGSMMKTLFAINQSRRRLNFYFRTVLAMIPSTVYLMYRSQCF